MTPQGNAVLLRGWILELSAAGVPSPGFDARMLAAAVLDVPRHELPFREITAEEAERIQRLISRRRDREPLQHILGIAPFLDLDLRVGPGVFVPRPETEALADHALGWLAAGFAGRATVVVDLCAGSAALALAIGTGIRDCRVVAVELSPAALDFAERNIAAYAARIAPGSAVEVRAGDATDPALTADLVGSVTAVLVNPPYVPDRAVPREPEVRLHDPALALYGGPDGLDVVRGILPVADALLRPGGLLAVEHADTQGEPGGVPALLRDAGWRKVHDHPDLAGRPRFTTGLRPEADDDLSRTTT